MYTILSSVNSNYNLRSQGGKRTVIKVPPHVPTIPMNMIRHSSYNTKNQHGMCRSNEKESKPTRRSGEETLIDSQWTYLGFVGNSSCTCCYDYDNDADNFAPFSLVGDDSLISWYLSRSSLTFQ
ncbi:hypothetical protein Droror1_Dr00007083 [Drosera rotundifolia]